MPRFYIRPEEIKKEVILLSPEESRHAVSVLRLKSGDTVEVFDGKGKEIRATVIGAKGGVLSLAPCKDTAKTDRKQAAATTELTLAVSVIKPERMELLIQKACELGVHQILPLSSERTVVRLSSERWESKLKRWRKIAVESCKQCGRSEVPEIREVVLYKKFIENLASYDKILIPTLAVAGGGLYKSLKKAAAQKVLVLIGPEGDFSPEEVEAAVKRGAEAVNLGPLVMRSETASMYVLSLLNFFYREIQPDLSKN